jgi:hypothetical protein
MNQRTDISRKRRRRLITLTWLAGLAALIIVLIRWEQTALLYILATLGVTALMVVVALADLEDKKTPAE